MGRSTVHYADGDTNNTLKRLHKKLRPAGTPVQRVEYIIELLLFRIFEVKLKQDPDFKQLRDLFARPNDHLLFNSLRTVPNERLLPTLNEKFFPFYASILSQARKVYKTNLGQKVQDQLVLIEEVFKNSNFTNNVKSGDLQEVLALIGEIDEDRLLKTDLLGDAIESALSETGGTKDMGLHRTPDHIRQFMVALTAPTFMDSIFDPACGTAGFGFDSYGYVTEAVRRSGKWPGPKAHPELIAYFQKYFAKHPAAMPSPTKSLDFYRSGIHGIEYLGMIRKMAAINFYIRGLNPQNIVQGDSLALFDPAKDGGSKTVVQANPPFGAERDQEAYPNVWAEFSRESETTILFVKLMLDALALGGRCAVIVSEGFLTWGQTSARTLRKMLVEENNLRAIISLPQGVFVSKGGVGPKTSILVFEKGGQTKEVWFYKVTNDGYTMGTNRRPIEGCQLVEALELFDIYIRHGKSPPETKHSFSVPAAWILNLDPRVKLRIEADTTAEFSERAAKERETLAAKLADLLRDGKITETDRDGRLAQQDEIWRMKTLNEIAKRVEAAYPYSFNLSNARSNLSQTQLNEWNTVFKDAIRRNGHTLDARFAALKDCPPEKAHSALAMLDVQDALEFDIARQYLMGYPVEELAKHNQLATLREIIENSARYPRVQLAELLTPVSRNVVLGDEILYRQVTIRLRGKGICLRQLIPGAAIKTEGQFLVRGGDFLMSKIDARNGAFGLVPDDLDGAIVTGSFQAFTIATTEIMPEYLVYVVTHPLFYEPISSHVSGATGRRSISVEKLLSFDIPLPPIDVQRIISQQIQPLHAFIKSGDQAIDAWRIDPRQFHGTEHRLTDLATIGTGSTPSRSNPEYFGGGIKWVLTTEIAENEIFDTSETLTDQAVMEFNLKIYPPGTVLLAMYGQGQTRGRTAILRCPAAITQNCAAIMPDTTRVLPEYLYFNLQSRYEEIRSQEYSGGGVPHLNAKIISQIMVPVPSLDEQQKIIARILEERGALQGVGIMIDSARRQADGIIRRMLEEGQ